MVTKLLKAELIATNAAAQGGDQRTHLLAGEHLIEAGFFHIQNLTLQGQYGLGAPIAALLRGAAGGITLHQEQF